MTATTVPPRSRRAGSCHVATRVLVALALVVAGFTTLTAVSVGTAAPAAAGAADEQAFISQINGLRRSHGLPELAVDANMSVLARQHTAEMAASQHLAHTANLPAGVTITWEKLGENVGFGSNIGLVWNAFLNSPAHLANLTDPAYNAVGVGVVVDHNGIVWTTHRFVKIASPKPPPYVPPPVPTPVTTTPAPRPTVAPAPAPSPKPAPRVTAAPVATTPPTTAAPIEAEPVTVSEPEMRPAPANPDHVASLLDALHAAD